MTDLPTAAMDQLHWVKVIPKLMMSSSSLLALKKTTTSTDAYTTTLTAHGENPTSSSIAEKDGSVSATESVSSVIDHAIFWPCLMFNNYHEFELFFQDELDSDDPADDAIVSSKNHHHHEESTILDVKKMIQARLFKSMLGKQNFMIAKLLGRPIYDFIEVVNDPTEHVTKGEEKEELLNEDNTEEGSQDEYHHPVESYQAMVYTPFTALPSEVTLQQMELDAFTVTTTIDDNDNNGTTALPRARTIVDDQLYMNYMLALDMAATQRVGSVISPNKDLKTDFQEYGRKQLANLSPAIEKLSDNVHYHDSRMVSKDSIAAGTDTHRAHSKHGNGIKFPTFDPNEQHNHDSDNDDSSDDSSSEAEKHDGNLEGEYESSPESKSTTTRKMEILNATRAFALELIQTNSSEDNSVAAARSAAAAAADSIDGTDENSLENGSAETAIDKRSPDDVRLDDAVNVNENSASSNSLSNEDKDDLAGDKKKEGVSPGNQKTADRNNENVAPSFSSPATVITHNSSGSSCDSPSSSSSSSSSLLQDQKHRDMKEGRAHLHLTGTLSPSNNFDKKLNKTDEDPKICAEDTYEEVLHKLGRIGWNFTEDSFLSPNAGYDDIKKSPSGKDTDYFLTKKSFCQFLEENYGWKVGQKKKRRKSSSSRHSVTIASDITFLSPTITRGRKNGTISTTVTPGSTTRPKRKCRSVTGKGIGDDIESPKKRNTKRFEFCTDEEAKFYEFKHLIKKLKLMQWTYITGPRGSLQSYCYVLPGRKAPFKGGEYGTDFFNDEDEVIDYCVKQNYYNQWMKLVHE